MDYRKLMLSAMGLISGKGAEAEETNICCKKTAKTIRLWREPPPLGADGAIDLSFKFFDAADADGFYAEMKRRMPNVEYKQ